MLKGLFVLVTAGLSASCGPDSGPAKEGEIEVLCAAGLRLPAEEAARAYEAEGLGRVRFQFGGSQSLLSALQISMRGDLYLPADSSYLKTAYSRGLVAEQVDIATMKAVLAVKKGNPKELRTFADVLHDGVRLVLANPELAAISQLTSKALPPDAWASLASHAVAMKPTVSDVANDIVLGAADAGIVWDATVHQTAALEAVDVPELAGVKGHVGGAVIVSGSNQPAARRFLRWLAAPDKGGPVFSKHGCGPKP